MEFNAIMQNLKRKVYHPIYLLQGDEPFFSDQVSNYIEKNVLSEAEKGFNQTVFYGKDTDERTIVEAALRFPMMAEKQVIIVKEAQSLKKIEELEYYASKPLASTILVINYKYKTLDGRTKLYKAIQKNGVILTTKKLYENQVHAWVVQYLKQFEYTITPQASQILTESLGTELSVVSNELNKLVIAVKDTNKITPEHIEKHIGLSKDFNVLELQDALGTRNILKANRIINYFSANPQKHPIQMTISILFGYFSKVFSSHFINDKSDEGVRAAMNLHPFYAKKIAAASKRYTPAKLYEIIGILREYDMKSKGVGVSPLSEPGDLQKEMIYKILH